MSFKYDVFFSYRHKPLDAEITEKVFHWFENYRLPPSLKEKGAKDIERAFRDTEELPVRRILTETIDEALKSSNALVVAELSKYASIVILLYIFCLCILSLILRIPAGT